MGVVFLSAIALIGCGTGSADVDNSVPHTTLELKTIFGWIDTTTTTDEDGVIKTKPLEKKHLTLFATGASFDPTEDIRFLSAADRFQFLLDNNLYGSVAITVSDLSKLTVGQTYDSTAEDSPFHYDVEFGQTELEDGTGYTAETTLGRKTSMTLTVNELGSKPGDKFKATIRYNISKDETDPSGVLTGEVNVVLSGPLVNERLANCNMETFGSTHVECN